MRRVAAFVVVLGGLLTAPAAALATGPATFFRAGSSPIPTPLGPGGVTIYATSPAYITVPVNGKTQGLERYASTHSFASVAVPDMRGGRSGERCFLDAHLIVVPRFVSGFKVGSLRYHGLFMHYASSFFLSGVSKPARCGLVRSPGPAIPTVSLGAGTARLSFDCLVRICRGTFATFGRPSSCSNPVTVLPGQAGCLPSVKGRFTESGGLSVSLQVKLFGRSAGSTQFALAVNGKLSVLASLASLRRTPVLPPRQHRASLSASCTDATLGSQATVSGSLSPGGARVPITLTFSGPAGASSTVSPTTGANSRYLARFTARPKGTWMVRATFAGDRTRRPAASPGCHFTVT